ncbi:MAG: hypothetical protein LUH04_03170 [Clostridium sp.]|nr:hypothetical protein [Clostridium sp.]
MRRTLKKIGILAVVFLIAAVIYFIAAQNTMEKENTVYTAMNEPTLPVIYPQVNGKEINGMHGYLQDMENQAARESITVLPEDRALKLRISTYGNTISGISYEVRSLSMDRLVEQTTLDSWDNEADGVSVTLPIQNLLAKNQPYLLTLFVSTGEKNIRYYTRIMWSDNQYAVDMLQLAEDFSRKSLDYNQARDLVSYLETNNTEDNSSLGHVTIRASFNHLTWDGLNVEMLGEPAITMKELDGTMGQIRVSYQVKITDEEGNADIVDVEDNYSMRWNEQRIYMMDYERTASQRFSVSSRSLSGKRILLGITNDASVRTKKSPNARYIAFKTGQELWCYDQNERQIVKVFSFESERDDGVRSRYNSHDIRILSAEDSGNVTFLVYGYMNCGAHEGRVGVALYSFDASEDRINEKFFIPAVRSYEQVKADVEKLSYLSGSGMMYLLLDGTVYGIDLRSNESMVVAQGLTEGSYGVSEDGSRLAWQEGSDIYRSPKLHLMDLNTAQKQEIAGTVDDYVRVLGFVGNDLIYGLGNTKDIWTVNGWVRDLPMYAMYIVGSDMEVVSQYEKEGIYISGVNVEDGRIHMRQLAKVSDQDYVFQNNDTIVCNEKFGLDPLNGIGWFASQDKGKLYFVQADQELQGTKVEARAPKTFSYENTGSLEPVKMGQADTQMTFNAYALGHYIGSSRNFKEAVDMAYEHMGVVTDENQNIVWDRINRKPIVNIKDPMSKANKMLRYLGDFTVSQEFEGGLLMVDARECTLSQMLYFIDKGLPVIAYTEPGKYILLSGYDQYNVSLYDPETQESWKMGMNDATAYFENLQNDFVCGKIVQ